MIDNSDRYHSNIRASLKCESLVKKKSEHSEACPAAGDSLARKSVKRRQADKRKSPVFTEAVRTQLYWFQGAVFL